MDARQADVGRASVAELDVFKILRRVGAARGRLRRVIHDFRDAQPGLRAAGVSEVEIGGDQPPLAIGQKDSLPAGGQLALVRSFDVMTLAGPRRNRAGAKGIFISDHMEDVARARAWNDHAALEGVFDGSGELPPGDVHRVGVRIDELKVFFALPATYRIGVKRANEHDGIGGLGVGKLRRQVHLLLEDKLSAVEQIVGFHFLGGLGQCPVVRTGGAVDSRAAGTAISAVPSPPRSPFCQVEGSVRGHERRPVVDLFFKVELGSRGAVGLEKFVLQRADAAQIRGPGDGVGKEERPQRKGGPDKKPVVRIDPIIPVIFPRLPVAPEAQVHVPRQHLPLLVAVGVAIQVKVFVTAIDVGRHDHRGEEVDGLRHVHVVVNVGAVGGGIDAGDEGHKVGFVLKPAGLLLGRGWFGGRSVQLVKRAIGVAAKTLEVIVIPVLHDVHDAVEHSV